MKTWITYTFAIFLGLATALLFGDLTLTYSILYTLYTITINIGVMIFIPMALICFASGVASLKKDRQTAVVFSSSFIWSIVTAIVIPLVAVFAFSLYPSFFPVTSTAGTMDITSELLPALFQGAQSSLMSSNTYYTLATTSSFILPIVIIAWILGIALKPNADVIKPAYIVMNSFSEVLFRISRTYTYFGHIFVYCTASFFFTQLYQEKTVIAAPTFFITLIVITLAILLIVIPLLFTIFTLGKKNPYKAIFRSLSAAIAALVSGNILAVSPVIESTTRHNLGVQKRVSATAVPLYSIFCKGGSAAIAAISSVAIIYAVTSAMPTASQLAIIALAATLSSFASSVAVSYESVFITIAIMKLTGISLYGAEMALFGVLPLINGLGIMIDSFLASLGTAYAGRRVRTDINPPYKDII